MTPSTRSTELAGDVALRRAEDGRRTQRGAQACPEGAGEARVAVLDGRCVAEHGRDETARLPLGGGCLEGRDRPHCTCRKSWLELATGSSRTSRLVNPPLRPYKPAASPAVDRKGKRPAGRWQACGLDARLGNRRAGPPRAAAAEHPVAADAGAARNTRCRAPGTEGYRRAAVLRLWRRRQQLSSATTKKAVEAGIRRIFYANVC